MKIKKLTMLSAVLALLAVGCNSDDGLLQQLDTKGAVQLTMTTASGVSDSATRAPSGEGEEDNYLLPSDLIPSIDDFTLEVTGKYTKTGTETEYVKKWDNISDFKTEHPVKLELEAGSYNDESTDEDNKYSNEYEAKIWHGNIEEQGWNKPYFEGYSMKGYSPEPQQQGDPAYSRGERAKFKVYPKTTTSVNVVARLANTCFTVHMTEWMLGYYTDIEFKIHVGEGEQETVYTFVKNTADVKNNIFTFNGPSTTTDPYLIFIKPGQQISISGKATATQSQAGTKFEFPKTKIADAASVKQEYHYAIEVDMDQAGTGAMTITWDDTFTNVDPVSVELNPDQN